MSFTGRPRVPPTPTLPKGEQIAVYGSYLEAQRAVDHLADKQFPVQLVTIVGIDLRMVERVTGRLSYPRVAIAGLASGAWFGLFVGVLLLMFSADSASFPLVAAIFIGAGFGMLFSVITYSFTGGKRDFTSASQIVAGSYSVLCAAEQAHKARNLLREIGGTVSGWPGAQPAPARAAAVQPAPAQPAPTAQQAPPPTAYPVHPPLAANPQDTGPVAPTEPPTQPPAPPQS
ncbi:general stress protein [Pengzhenrongella sicca]|uniref:General stress protein 17M-like domain-containing protein n=1 Tax=Pengzhenrongella sicca TaxID=2819238 RepID=A0A8A4ZDE6_9MICO|nr:general stress protein [Pengzhenrongella sicca]QTE30000.1 hypothetical protein J4E96_02950 [Pengzhenrongella sicca]